MIKLSRTGITTLKRQYRAVLLKCLLINAGILLAANGAMAADYYVAATSGGANNTQITLGTAAATDADAYASAAQGATADATAATVATYGDIVTHNVAEFDEAGAAAAVQTAIVNGTITAAKATQATQDGAGNVITTTYATKNDLTTGVYAVDKALKDGAGNVIATTYATKNDLTTGVYAVDKALKDGSGNVITSTYATKATTINGHNLESNITLTASDILTGDGQLAAVNSGITSEKVGQYNTLYNALKDVTASATELNILDGATVTTAELNILDGATVTTDELNVLDGVTGKDSAGIPADEQGSDTVLATTQSVVRTITNKAQNATFTTGGATSIGAATTIAAAINNVANAVDNNAIIGADAASSAGYTADATVKAAVTAIDGALKNAEDDIADIITDMTVAADGNYIDAGTDVAGNLGALDGAVKANADAIAANAIIGAAATSSAGYTADATVKAAVTAIDGALKNAEDDIADINALIGTPDGAKSGDQNSLLYGVAITGDTGVDGQKTVIGALKTVAEGAAGKAMNNVFTGTTNTFGAGENQQVIIGNTGSLTANTSLKVGTSDTNMLYVSSAGTVIGAANAITGTSGALNMGGNDLTNIDDITATGKVSANSFQVDANNTFASNSLTVGNGTKAATLSGDTMTLSSGTVVATFKAETVDSVDMLHLSVAGTNENKVLSLDNDTTVAGTLTIGEANAITGTANTLSMGNNALTDITDIASTALTTDSTGKTVAIGGDGYTTTITGAAHITGATTLDSTLAVAGDFAVNTDKFTVDAETGDTTVAGTLTIGEANAITGTEDTLDMGGNSLTNIVDITAAGALTADGESKFAKDDEDVYSLDVTTDGVTANKVITAAAGVKFGTDETPMTSVVREAVAAKADEANNSVVASAAALQATRAAINSDVASVLGGVFAIDDTEKTVSYDNTALAGTNGFDNAAGDLTEALTNYANHVAAATGLSYDETGANVTTYARADEVNYAGIADNTSLRDAIVQLDTNIGDAPTTTLNGVDAGNTVNANIDTINTALGDVETAIRNSHYGNGAADMSEMVSKVDNKLYALDRDVRKLKKEFKAGMASVAAMSALVPNARANGNTQLSVGTGAYDGHMAAAIGGFHWFNNNVMMNVGVAYGDSSEATYRAGLTFTW